MALPNPIVEGNVLQVPEIRSVDYVTDGTTGWRIGRDGTADFNSLNVRGDLGGGSVSGDLGIFGDVQLPNYSSLNAQLDSISTDLSGRCVGFYQQTDAGINGVTTEIILIGLDVYLQPNRIYTINGLARVSQNVIDTNNQWQALIRATIGPSAAVPTTASTPIVQHVGSLWQQAPLHTSPFDSGNIPVDTPLRLILTVARIAGTATNNTGPSTNGVISTGGVTYTFRYPGCALWVLDHGPSTNMPTFTGYNSTDTPPVTPNPPAPKTYTKTYYATWSRTYDGDNTTTWDDTPYCYQGYYSSTRGHTKSLIGFDYATIASNLSGATINSCYVTIKGAHSYYNDGFALDVGTHNYTAKPSTWANGNVNQQRTGINRPPGIAAGETVKLSLGTTIGAEFKSQVSRGIAIGPGLDNQLVYYGYLYGATQSGKPYLTITYTK
jgi:hypothetical protein